MKKGNVIEFSADFLRSADQDPNSMSSDLKQAISELISQMRIGPIASVAKDS